MMEGLQILLMLFLSGCKNALYYVDRTIGAYVFTILTGFIIMAYGLMAQSAWFAIPECLLLAMCLVFYKERTDRVHVFENLWKYAFMVVAILCGGDVLRIPLAFAFGNILFNTPIQYSAYGRYFSNEEYELIEIGDLKVDKPRMSLYGSLLCGLLWVLCYYFDISITINDITQLLQ